MYILVLGLHEPSAGVIQPRMRRAVYLTAWLSGLAFWGVPVRDPDLGWHLAGGGWIWSHNTVPFHDFINTFNPYWHDYHWLGQVAMYGLYVLGGYDLLAVAAALLMGWIGTLLVDIILLSAGRPLPAYFVLASFYGALFLIAEVFSVRPQMISVAVIALAVRRLLQRRAWWEMPYLLLLSVLLVNVHVYWVFVPCLWFLYRCVPRLLSLPGPGAGYAWGGLALLSLAGLASPYGLLPLGAPPSFLFMNYALLWDLFLMPATLKANIGEFRGGLAVPGPTPWLILAYVVAVARVFRLRLFAVDPGRVSAGVIFPLLAINSVKFVSVFAVASLPFLVGHVGAMLRPTEGARSRAVGVGLVAVSMAAAAVLAGWYMPWFHRMSDAPYSDHPLAACRRIASLELSPRHGRDHIRVLTPFTYGGWCRWALYEEDPDADFRVTTDGRTQGVPAHRYFEAYDLFMVRNEWRETLYRWDPDVLLVPKTFALASVLAMAPQAYTPVYDDGDYALFVPVEQGESRAGS